MTPRSLYRIPRLHILKSITSACPYQAQNRRVDTPKPFTKPIDVA
jgi:hypothetical protein